jgi:hypothetical protein
MRFGTETSGYCSREIMRQNTMLIGVLLFQDTADFATHQSAALHGRIFTSFLPRSRTPVWWEKAENGMNHHGKIGSLRACFALQVGRVHSLFSATLGCLPDLVCLGRMSLEEPIGKSRGK